MTIPILPADSVSANADRLPDAALAYARRGWSIIPVLGKKAAGLWKPFQKRAAEATLRKMFAKKGVTGLAVITGKVSGGLAVRDFDDADAYDAWANANPEDAASSPTVRTARGYHVYGTLDAEQVIDFGDGERRADRGTPAFHRRSDAKRRRQRPRADPDAEATAAGKRPGSSRVGKNGLVIGVGDANAEGSDSFGGRHDLLDRPGIPT